MSHDKTKCSLSYAAAGHIQSVDTAMTGYCLPCVLNKWQRTSAFFMQTAKTDQTERTIGADLSLYQVHKSIIIFVTQQLTYIKIP